MPIVSSCLPCCDDEDFSSGEKYKSNEELYISDISTCFSFAYDVISVFIPVVKLLCHEDLEPSFNEKTNTKKGLSDYLLENVTFSRDVDVIFPVYKDKDGDLTFTTVNINTPTDFCSSLRPDAKKQKVIICNKLIILTLVTAYLSQYKNNCKANMTLDEYKIFEKNFYEQVVNELYNKTIREILENNFKEGESKNDEGEEKSIFDLIDEVFTSFDNNDFIKKNNEEIFQSLNINNINNDNNNIIMNNNNIINERKEDKERLGLLLSIPNNLNNIDNLDNNNIIRQE